MSEGTRDAGRLDRHDTLAPNYFRLRYAEVRVPAPLFVSALTYLTKKRYTTVRWSSRSCGVGVAQRRGSR